VAVWGRAAVPGARALQVIRIEDGFLRSVGLGAELVRPLSWVLDRRGIYYDASQPSDLEHILQTTEFSAALCERAVLLRQRIVAAGITKYNLAGAAWQRPTGERSVVLVPGQVESDDAVRYGAAGIVTNLQLLEVVRAARPEAYVVYKPHPDVLAGLRRGGTGEDQAGRWCDEIVTDVPISSVLPLVDEVHVNTSLAGFEALLRGKPVTTYGQPFYAGWGLTTDMSPPPRRARRLALDELIAGALILYPSYFDYAQNRAATAEEALDTLIALRRRPPRKRPLWRLLLRWFRRWTGRAN
jgi:capsular polysaccharide export protein